MESPRLPVTIVIPCYEVSGELETLLIELQSVLQCPIVLVDDGSSEPSRKILDEIARRFPEVTLLRHATNLGKGQALKTAFNHVLLPGQPENVGVVTADADGQHLAKDIAGIAAAIAAEPKCLWLGARRFSGEVPMRSLLGNRLTKILLRSIAGIDVDDTQTGLRGIPRQLMREMLRVPAQRYEFEFEMLVKARRTSTPIRQREISTVYLDGNRSSHFHPLLDSARIYFILLRFLANSLVTAVIDYTTFILFYAAAHNILLGTALARTVAGIFNFYVGRTLVFKSRARVGPEALRFIATVVILGAISYSLVTAFVIVFGLPVVAAKLVSEALLYVASFAIQNLLVFNRNDDDGNRLTVIES